MRYFPLLDPVRFGYGSAPSDVAHAWLSASSAVLRSILVAGETPVLAENQVFDNRMVLELVGEEDADAAALLRLVRVGRIRVRVFTVGEGAQATVVGAFRERLRLGPGRTFRFSAWPELADPDAREALAAVIDGESTDGLTPELRARLSALRLLDRQFRVSSDDERALPVPELGLSRQVTAVLTDPGQSGVVSALWSQLSQFRDGRGADAYDLERRSDWLALMDDFMQDRSMHPAHGVARTIRDLLDHQYNLIVARSVGARSLTSELAELPEGELSVAAPPSLRVQQSEVHTVPPPGTHPALQWQDLPDLLPDLEVLSRRGRREWLTRAGVLEQVGDHAVSWRLRLHRPRWREVGMAGATAGLGATLGAVVGGVPGALLGAVVEAGARGVLPRGLADADDQGERRRSVLLRSRVGPEGR